MIDNSWAFNLENQIFTRVKTEGTKKLKTKYPTIYFTTSGKNSGDPVYPTVYIHELPGAEVGKDLVGKSINGVLETIQVEVITDKTQQDAKYIMSAVLNIFKDMSFAIDSFPNFEDGTSYHRLVSRCERTIGNGEKF